MILLDTNALLWLQAGHPRSRPLARATDRLYLSPASFLEIKFLPESRRVALRAGATLATLADDERWAIDDPPAMSWFGRAMEIAWTRDPFDRLLVAHAAFRGWRLATGDGSLLDRLGPTATFEL